MKRPNSRLRCEALERRDAPAYFGRPWADHRVSISFVPDGIAVDGLTSNLFETMQANGLAQTTWQTEILRAAQTWAQPSDLNVGLILDGGQPVGVTGEPQGDSRFGDIRISARPLSREVIAVTIPPGILGGTRVGDIIINSTKPFAIGASPKRYDLYTVLLQEMGHAFGLDNSLDPASPMFEYYQGVKTGLTPGDVAAIQSLYAPRIPDGFDSAPGGNDAAPIATVLPVPLMFQAGQSRTLSFTAALSSIGDVDFYRFKVPANVTGMMGVKVRTAGLSLVAPVVSVISVQTGTMVGSMGSPSGINATDLAINFGPVAPSQEYFVRVEHNSNSFAVGSYGLDLVFDLGAYVPPLAPIIEFLNDALHTNDLPITATPLLGDVSFLANRVFRTWARIDDLIDSDYYSITGPADMAGVTALSVIVRAMGPENFQPAVQIANGLGQFYPTQVLSSGQGEYIVQVPVIQANQTYLVRVKASDSSPSPTGNYALTADFYAPVVNLTTFASGTLTNANREYNGTMTVDIAKVYQFVLSSSTANAALPANIRVTLYDRFQRPVLDLATVAGEIRSAQGFLAAGTYHIRAVAAPVTPGDSLPQLGFALRGTGISDPIGVEVGSPDEYLCEMVDEELNDALFVSDPGGDPEW